MAPRQHGGRGDPDDGLRALFAKHLRRVHWTPIELGVMVSGVPDHNGCSEGVDFWVEYKATEDHSVGLEALQVGWILTRMRHGGRCFVVTRQRHDGGPRKGLPVDALWVHEGWDAAELKAGGLLACPPVLHLDAVVDGPSHWDWDRVRDVLVRWEMSRRG